MTPASPPSVTVGAKRTLEYVVDCLARLNATGEIELRSVGQCIAKAADVGQLLRRYFGVQVSESRLASLSALAGNGIQFSSSSTRLYLDRGSLPASSEEQPSLHGGFVDGGFVRFPVYSLLLDDLLCRTGKLLLSLRDDRHSSLEVKPAVHGFQCTATRELVQRSGERRDQEDGDKTDLVAALTRAGLLQSPRWERICTRIGTSDDVILGLDTNVLYNCAVTQQLLDGFVLTSGLEQVHGPNWLLLVVPATVMHEIEQAANSRKDKGDLSRVGRMGYRALQEILELDQSQDLRGVSLLIVGESNPVLDTRVELQGLRSDFKVNAKPSVQGRLYRKHSAGDTIIRDQFKAFLRQLGFHKGAYFLTSDKSNSALGRAEGLHSLYFPPPPPQEFPGHRQFVEAPVVSFEGEHLHLTCPLGKLVYELAVEYGRITVQMDGGGKPVAGFRCDLKGDSLEHWVQRDLWVDRPGFKELLAGYEGGGRKVPLIHVEELWTRMSRMSMDWL